MDTYEYVCIAIGAVWAVSFAIELRLAHKDLSATDNQEEIE